MTSPAGWPDWSAVDLVVFDVDGTLYNQRALRLKMLGQIAAQACLRGQWRFVRTLSIYRRLREEMGVSTPDRFAERLLEQTAVETGQSVATVRHTVQEWIHERPLPHLYACRYQGIGELFQRLRARQIKIGIWSDYPVGGKLGALGLEANFTVSAEDPEIDRLKPHPLGLHALMTRSGVTPDRTLMIGDRPDRDGAGAAAAGVTCLIRAGKADSGYPRFASFKAPQFSAV